MACRLDEESARHVLIKFIAILCTKEHVLYIAGNLCEEEKEEEGQEEEGSHDNDERKWDTRTKGGEGGGTQSNR